MSSQETEEKLNFRRAYIQLFETPFCLTSYGCFICQTNFLSPSDYDDHIGFHKGDEDIPFSRRLQGLIPTFTISYNHSADTNMLNFTIASEEDVSIEKIVIIRPEGRKQMHLIDKAKIDCSKRNRIYNISVDCFLFNIAKEQPFIIIYRSSIDVSTRQLEQFIFFRKQQFPKTKISLTSNIVPQHAKLQFKHKLPQKLPSLEIRSLSKENYKEENIMSSNPIMRQFLLEKKLKKSNYANILSFLLQMEDHFILSSYEKLNLKNLNIEHLGSENYSFLLSQRKKVKQFLSLYDEIVVSSLTETDDYYAEDVFEYNYKDDKPKKYFGCIYKIQANTVFFSLRGKTKIPIQEKFNIKIYPSRIPFRYQYEAIRRISNSAHILNVLFPTENLNDHISTISLNFFNEAVKNNPEQSQAVRNIVNAPNNSMPFILFGPPGTGKSTTIIETLLQLWKTKPLSKILVTSGSNAACDEVAKRLCKIFEEIDGEGFNLLRIYGASSEKRMDNTEEILVEASNFAHGYHFYPSLDSIYLFRIVVATLTICGKLVQAGISDSYFTHIIIDECAASTESEALVGIAGLMGPNTKLILSGDPRQLGPVLKCMPAENFGLGVSMMERLLNLECYAVDPETNVYDKSIQTILRRNFRSNADILSISNELCYNSQLLACAKSELTNWVQGWKKLPQKCCPIIFHNVYGQTKKEDGGTSSMNSEEIEVVMEYVRDILENGINGRTVQQNEIGIISPYKKQHSVIRDRLDENNWFKVETGSAETFQGQEKPIIIISTVKSWTKYIGFLNNLKRLNVMLTRAQALMIIVGNPRSLQNDENWFQVLKYFKKKKAFKGKYFNLPEEPPSFDVKLLPDVPKTERNYNNNRKQFKPRRPHQSNNVRGTAFNKNASQGIKKELVSAATATSSPTVSKSRYNQNRSPEAEVLNINKGVEATPAVNKSIRTTSSQSFGTSTSKTSVSSPFREEPRTRIYPVPSAPSVDAFREYRDIDSSMYRQPPPSYESLSRDLNRMRLDNSNYSPRLQYVKEKPKKSECVIL